MPPHSGGSQDLSATDVLWLTQVYEASSLTGPLRRADAQELTLAANLRVLSDVDVGSTTVAAGVSLSGELPDVPLGLDADAASYEKFVLPPLGIEELGSLLQYYRCAALRPLGLERAQFASLAVNMPECITARRYACACDLLRELGHAESCAAVQVR